MRGLSPQPQAEASPEAYGSSADMAAACMAELWSAEIIQNILPADVPLYIAP